MELLKLVALDAEDLAIISTHLQDAVVKVGDISYMPADKRFVLVARRFDWECGCEEPQRRRLSGIHFERVNAVRMRGFDRSQLDRELNLLGIAFEEKDAPSGTATLLFEEGAAVQLEIECIKSQMRDVGPVFPCNERPVHAEAVASGKGA